MSEDTLTTPEQAQVVETAVTPTEAKNTEQATVDHMIPKSRFDEVNNQLKQLRAEQEKAAKEREKAERERLEKQSEYETLYKQAQSRIQELEPVQERYNAFLEQTRERNERRIKELPKEMQTLVPEYDDPLRLGAWLDANEAVLVKRPTAPTLDGGAGRTSQNSNAPSLADIKEQAARLNVSWQLLADQYGVTISK